MAAIFGEADALLSMTILRIAAHRARFARPLQYKRSAQSAELWAVAKPSLTKAIRSPCSPPRDEWRSMN
jgi:hypothetical protein